MKTLIAVVGGSDPSDQTERLAVEVGRCLRTPDLRSWAAGALLLALLGGCGLYTAREAPYRPVRGIYHTVRPGESLWRISRAYGVDVEQIAVLNGIANPDRLKAGVRIFIPRAGRELRVTRAVRSAPPRVRPRWAAPVKRAKKGARRSARGGVRSGAVKFKWPVKGKLVRRFGSRRGVKSDGIDIVAPRLTSVRAAAAGRVIFSDWGPGGLGKTIIIRHPGGQFHSVYSHNAVNLVKPGERVKRGAVIARLGNTGDTRGARLHFEIRYRTKPRNPLTYLP